MEEEARRIESPAEAIAWMKAHPFGDTDRDGIDLSLIDRMLQLTPTERIRRLHRVSRLLRQRNDRS